MKEAENNQVSVRQRGGEDLGAMNIDAFADLINKSIENELALNV